MKRLFFLSFLILNLFISTTVYSQYIVNGAAKKNSCNCYTLTPESTFQSGSVWNSNKISLNNSFDFWFNVYLGCYDSNGADGIVFILQPISTSIGASGEGMGFSGVSPSIGIAIDTYQNFNLNDPSYDHISIQANGIVDHTSDLVLPVPVSSISDNVEDCKWHKLRISWDANTKWLRTYFDDVLRVEKQIDLVSTIFQNDPNVYWGFTGATGGSVNLQQFCTALDPIFTYNINGNATCAPATIQFSEQSESFAPITSYAWNFGNGNTSTLKIPPLQYYPNPGEYEVSFKIKAQDGCESESKRTITIGSVPDAEFHIYDTCTGSSPRLEIKENTGVSYQWLLDGNVISNSKDVQLDQLVPGNYNLEMVLTSLYGCGVPDRASQLYTVKPKPEIFIEKNQICKTITFNGVQLDNLAAIHEWNWLFGDGNFSKNKMPVHTFPVVGNYDIRLWALSINGCISDTVKSLIYIPDGALAIAGKDTSVIKDRPFQLNALGNGSFLWSPSVGLNNPTIANPIGILSADQEYILTVTTPEGCIAKDTIKVKIFEGPAVYMPTAFTPNGDGLNDVLRPVYVGISQLERFNIYNRWGQVVFSTTEMERGWDGKVGGINAMTGTYVWIINVQLDSGKKNY